VPVNVTTIIKKNRVRTAPASPAGSAPRPASRPGSAPSDGGAAQVHIAQCHDDHAVLEIRCPCGNVIHVECRWPAPGAEGADDAPASPGNGRPASKEAP